MKPILLSHSDSAGGAARAAFRLHQALISSNIDSKMQVGLKKLDNISIDGPVSKLSKLSSQVRPHIGSIIADLQKPYDSQLHSVNFLSSGLVNKLNNSDASVLNLHWINNEFMSIEDIGSLKKPIVWTLHDMWAFCGAEHYAPDDKLGRWKHGYFVENRPFTQKGIDLDRWVWRRKKNAWLSPMHIVTPSNWLADCVKKSALMRDWPVTVIPNPIDIRQFQPWPKKQAREILALPLDAKLVMFGAIGGGADPRKGWDLLQLALGIIANQKLNIECVVFGQNKPQDPPMLNLPLHWIGHVNDDVTLALLYSAADVMVVPSLQENLPQSATEAQACGCPVVAFNCTGLPDAVEHKTTGYLANPYDVNDLAQGILWTLADKNRHFRISTLSRERAVLLWSKETIVQKYLAVYEAAIKPHKV